MSSLPGIYGGELFVDHPEVPLPTHATADMVRPRRHTLVSVWQQGVSSRQLQLEQARVGPGEIGRHCSPTCACRILGSPPPLAADETAAETLVDFANAGIVQLVPDAQEQTPGHARWLASLPDMRQSALIQPLVSPAGPPQQWLSAACAWHHPAFCVGNVCDLQLVPGAYNTVLTVQELEGALS